MPSQRSATLAKAASIASSSDTSQGTTRSEPMPAASGRTRFPSASP